MKLNNKAMKKVRNRKMIEIALIGLIGLIFSLKLRKVKKLYKEVVEDFPGAEEEKEIRFRFYDYVHIAGYCVDEDIHSLSDEELLLKKVRKPMIGIGKAFFNYNKEEKKVILAHEIGHQEESRDKNNKRLKTRQELFKKLDLYKNGEIPYMKRRKIERLEDLSSRVEIAADNYVAKTKYAQGLIQFYKKLPNKKNRIYAENLERKLGAEK